MILYRRPKRCVGSPLSGINVVVLLAHGLSVFLPCFLVGSAVANERSEFFNGCRMGHERFFEYVSNDRRVMGSVMASKVDLRDGWSEGRAKLCPCVPDGVGFGLFSGVSSVDIGELDCEAIRKKGAKQSADNSKASGNQSNFVGSKLHDYIIVFCGGLVGLAIGAAIIHVFFWLKHGISPLERGVRRHRSTSGKKLFVQVYKFI